MPVQLLQAAFDTGQLTSPVGARFFGYQVLSNCTLHPNGTAECRGTNCDRGYGRRHAGMPTGPTTGPAAATATIRCEPYAAIPFSELARNPDGTGCGDALDALLEHVRNQTFYPGAPKAFDGPLQPSPNFNCNAAGLVSNVFVDENDREPLTLSLELAGPCSTPAEQPDVYAQCVTGRLSISPNGTAGCNGTYTAALRATDATGASAVIGGEDATWEMSFRGRNTLPIGSIQPDEDRMGDGTGYIGYDFTRLAEDRLVSVNRSIWAFGEPYHLVPLDVAVHGVESNTITFRLDPNPDGFFMNSDTGEIIGVPRAPRTSHRRDTSECRLVATAAGFNDTVLGTFNFTFAFKDTDPSNPRLATNGPNNRGCGNNGKPVELNSVSDGRSEFDGSYDCDCAGTLHNATNQSYGGLNCDEVPVPVATASSTGNDSGIMVGASLGAVLFLLLVALITFRVQLYLLKHRPVDVGITQEEVLASLGLAATQNISRTELGISLLFDRALPPPDTDGGAQFETDLVAVLRRAAPQIKAGLQAAKITVGAPASRRVLVIMPKSNITLPAEAVVELLAAKAAKGKLAVGDDGGCIVDASVAVPRRVPREVPRRALTRLRPLGEGAYGEVHQYQLEEKSMPSYFVAAKSVKKGKASGSADARDALLREAALGALLDHRNVVATVGVVTTPRDVPALLLLSFCPEGTLETLAEAASPTSITVAERLTYCAQTLQGLQYIASIRIVHRDVAARNVLLDSTMTCKVSDLGMATALQEDGKEYVRATEEMAMRWAAPEVIAEGKYSVQSDVWAFGVLAYEVFACGTLPYADQFDNLTEVSAFVKQGGKLGRPNPEACPLEVYAELMLPCFAADPADRPSFGELYDVAVRHGAEEDDDALAARKKAGPRKRHASVPSGDCRHLAPSVHYLSQVLVPELMASVTSTVKANLAGAVRPDDQFPLMDVDLATSFHTKEFIVVPQTKDVTCLRDHQLGAVFVDTLVGDDHVGPATAILSCKYHTTAAGFSRSHYAQACFGTCECAHDCIPPTLPPWAS